MIRSTPEAFRRFERLPQHMTAEDEAIVNDLGHVAFMAWLAEARDRRDARRMLQLTRDRKHGVTFGEVRPVIASDLFIGG